MPFQELLAEIARPDRSRDLLSFTLSLRRNSRNFCGVLLVWLVLAAAIQRVAGITCYTSSYAVRQILVMLVEDVCRRFERRVIKSEDMA